MSSSDDKASYEHLMVHKKTGFVRIFKAGLYSLQGIRSAIKYESAFRQEFFLALIFIPLVFFFDLTTIERVLLVGVTLLVLIVELINSAIEAVVDRVSIDMHELSGRAKDMGSAAVMITLFLWIYAWLDIVVISRIPFF